MSGGAGEARARRHGGPARANSNQRAALAAIGTLPRTALSERRPIWQLRRHRSAPGVHWVHAAANCANCETPLTGPYCAQCGQHAHESSRSIGALFHDAWHAVSHVDGRFWQTLAALLLRPGYLTREYFAERRARYLPPVRLYLVLSVLFFALAATGRHVNERAADALKTLPPDTATAAAARSGPSHATNAGAETAAPRAQWTYSAGTPFDPALCRSIELDWPLPERSARDFCVRIAPDGGRAIMLATTAAVPKMMFVFLPIMALVMLLLYWRPRRYYVEHLVFFLHTHSAVFLILILTLLLSRLAVLLPALRVISGLADFAGTLYVIWYIYKALRIYYGQGRWLTLAKLSAVAVAYFAFLLATLLATVALVATLVS